MDTPSESVTSAHLDNCTPETARLYQEGLIAGTLGAVTIALWFLILDLLQGRPLFTPTVLGTALFKGAGTFATPAEIPISLDMVVGFTFVHWLVFAAIGGIASRLLGWAEHNPNLGFGVLLLFVVFEFGFLAGAMVFAKSVLQALAWPTVLIGNLLAAISMGFYLWHRHPHMTIRP
jgi:hypothetical protein